MKKLINYTVWNNEIHLSFANDESSIIYLNTFSGKIYYRMKINTISSIRHTGIYLGKDIFGNNYYLHNHYLTGKPAIVSESEFTKGMPLYEDDALCINSPLQILIRALNSIIQGEPFDFINHNCQTFTSVACNNIRRSTDVEKWQGIAFVGLILIAVVTLNSN